MKSLIFVIALFSAMQVVAQCVQDSSQSAYLTCKGAVVMNTTTTVPAPPTKTSQLVNDSGFLTAVNWNMITGIPAFSKVAMTGQYADLLGLPVMPPAQIQADWNQTNPAALDYIKNKPTISTYTVDPTIDWTKENPKTMALLTLDADNATLHCTLRSGQPCKF